MKRRSFLAGGSAALLCTTQSAAALPEVEATQLDALLEQIFAEQVAQSPETMTSLGLDVGEGAWAKARLDDQSCSHEEQMSRRRRRWLTQLRRIDRSRLTGLDAANYDCVAYDLERALSAAAYAFGRPGFPQPYVLSQLGGTYQSTPDFLDTQHGVVVRRDAEAYLERLRAFARGLDEETVRARADAAAGIVPPDFVIERTLVQMRCLRATPIEQTTLAASLARRTRERGIRGDWSARAIRLVAREIWPALDRQIALVQSWSARAVHDAGVWRLPQGADYYRFALRYQTTTGMSPDEIHALGLELVEEQSARADTLLKAHGLTRGSVGERYAALTADPRFIYPNTEEGRAALISYLNELVAAVRAKLPAWFGAVPRAALEVRRVPSEIEAGAPGGYYQDGALDGTRPGVYYINLRDTAEVPRWTLPTLTYHEGIPGHHLQGALVLEAQGLPMIRRVLWFTAYGEGWALYAEQLADEMGLYENDAWARLGYLRDALFRAVRLVLDSGLHAKRWSREQAIAYYVDKLGSPRTAATTEVERYCVWPGQASSYMVGKITWLRLREAARARLGHRFDVRAFHDAGLLTGPMPLEILTRRYEDWLRNA